MKDWLATSTYVVPLDDLREHDPDNGECWCRPLWDGDILVHNSADGRELSERRPALTKAFDDATAACRIVLEIHHRRTAEDFASAALRGALPASPPPWFRAMYSNHTVYADAGGMWTDLRAHLLGEDA